MDTAVSLLKMPIGVQISNVGSEVNRALRWRKAGNRQREIAFCEKAIEFLNIMKQDPKNKHRIGEIDACIEELKDFFLGSNEYNTTEETLIRYYDAFLYQAMKL